MAYFFEDGARGLGRDHVSDDECSEGFPGFGSNLGAVGDASLR